jgi:DNA-binding MarR family transcriptional regulator
MSTAPGPRWLDDGEMDTWLALWSVMEWLPVRLDAQLRRDSGLSQNEYNALSQISMAPHRTVRLSELARVANMTLSHLSRVITRLENSGWVVRTPDPGDGRYTLARLTDAGLEKVTEAAPGHVEAVRRHVFDHLTPEQSAALGDAAARIVEILDPPRPAR